MYNQFAAIQIPPGSEVADCNANGIPDSCDLASGTSADRNGNGIPDECDPNPVLALTSNASACNTVNSTVTVEARLSGASQPVVAGQMLVQWDASKLSLSSVNPGDAPFNVVYSLNPSAGQATVLVSVEPGSSGEVVGNKAMARLNFTVVGGSCDGSQTGVNFFSAGPLQTEFADGLGNAFAPTLVGSAGFVVDDGNPVLSNVPADRTVRREAGDGAFATGSLGAPVATDSCSPLTETATRSDGQPLSAAYPVGVTTVTWRAVDPCGNSAEATTQVTVEPYNTMSFSVSYAGGGFASSMARNLSLSVLGAGGAQARTASATFGQGTATFEVTDLPVDSYSCTTVEDTARSLRRRVDVTDGGANWTATATLVLGDLIDDEVIDVLDWGAYVVRNPNTAHDLNGDGVTNAADGQFILNNFGAQGDTGCVAGFDGPATAIESISVAELVQRGLPELAGADLNGDGWLDLADMGMAD